MSNRLQCDHLRSANARSRGGPSRRGNDEDGISEILQDNGNYDTRMMGQRVWEEGDPRMMAGQVMTSSERKK